MTPSARLLLLAAAALAAGCVPTQRAVRGPSARGTEAWSWRMGATDGTWSSDRTQNAARAELASESARTAAEPEPEPAGAVEDEAEMTLEPDPVGPAKKPVAVAVAAARPAKKPARVQPLRASDSDEEFLNKILDDNADAEGGEITMAAVELPRSKKKERDLEPAPAPVKKKKMTRAERRKARLLARAEKKKAREMAAREARLRGKRARIDEEEQTRASHARKAHRKKRKGTFFKNGEGFIDDDGDRARDEDDDGVEVVSSSDEDDDGVEVVSTRDEDDEADEDEDEEEAPPPPKKKAKPAPSKAVAKAGPVKKVKKVKSDWRGQVVDDEDPLKAKK